MPDLSAFVRKSLARLRTRGVRDGATSTVQEAAAWLFSQVHEDVFGGGQLIWEDEWDICCVADATRWDQYRQVADGERWPAASAGWSVGSASPEWYGNTFTPANLPNERIGLVTANPFAGKPSERMAELRDATPVHEHLTYTDYVYEDAWGCEVGGGYLDTVHPAEVTDRAYAAWREQDLDRLVVHYMQPHLPFRSHPEWFGRRGDLDEFGEPAADGDHNPYTDDEHTEIWKQVRSGDRERDAVWAAYCDNLDWALEEINRLRVGVDATLLVTSDHGNAIGEWGLWSHPPNFHTPQLRRVPWELLKGDGGDFDTRSVDVAGADRSVAEQLAALGYTE